MFPKNVKLTKIDQILLTEIDSQLKVKSQK